MKIKFKLLSKIAKLPEYKRIGDAAFDLASTEGALIKAGEWKAIPIGIASEFNDGYFVSFRDRSGLALNHGLHVLGGVIDSNYRGEWKVILMNSGNVDYKVESGERIAQAIVHKLPKVDIIQTQELSENADRGEKGFGSSGRK